MQTPEGTPLITDVHHDSEPLTTPLWILPSSHFLLCDPEYKVEPWVLPCQFRLVALLSIQTEVNRGLIRRGVSFNSKWSLFSDPACSPQQYFIQICILVGRDFLSKPAPFSVPIAHKNASFNTKWIFSWFDCSSIFLFPWHISVCLAVSYGRGCMCWCTCRFTWTGIFYLFYLRKRKIYIKGFTWYRVFNKIAKLVLHVS